MGTVGYIECTVRVHKEGKHFVATCEELDVSSFGDSTDEALEAIEDAVLTHLSALMDLGELMDYFKRRGVKFHRRDVRPKPQNVRVGLEDVVSRRRIPVPAGMM